MANEPTDAHKSTARLLTKLLGNHGAGGRDALHARLRKDYAELEPLKSTMSKVDRDRFEEIGDLLELLASPQP